MSCSCLLRSIPAASRASSLVSSRAGAFGSTSSSIRAIHAPASMPVKRRVPEMRGSLTTPHAVLALSQRSLESYAPKLIPAELDPQAAWTALFTKSSAELAEAGMSVQERRYTLWLLEKYRRGEDLRVVAHPARAKKTIRGWGPKIQNGKAIR